MIIDSVLYTVTEINWGSLVPNLLSVLREKFHLQFMTNMYLQVVHKIATFITELQYTKDYVPNCTRNEKIIYMFFSFKMM